MKKLALVAIPLFLFAVALSSCSSCYDCEQQVEIEVTQPDGSVVTETETATDELCTASNSEVDDKESDGFTCSRQ